MVLSLSTKSLHIRNLDINYLLISFCSIISGLSGTVFFCWVGQSNSFAADDENGKLDFYYGLSLTHVWNCHYFWNNFWIKTKFTKYMENCRFANGKLAFYYGLSLTDVFWNCYYFWNNFRIKAKFSKYMENCGFASDKHFPSYTFQK